MALLHVSEDLLDQYAMGVLSQDELAGVEEHLLLCPECQARLEETDEFVATFRKAAVEPQVRTLPAWWHWKIVWGTAAAAAAVAITIAIAPAPKATAPMPVSLYALRGPDTGARVASGKPYVLLFDAIPSKAPSAYEVEIVDTTGKQVLRTEGALRDGRLSASVRKLSRGTYWVRVYRREKDRELLAEYGLRAE